MYLLTDGRPALLPAPVGRGLSLAHAAPATDGLLADLRADAGMAWIPQTGWLTQVRIDAAADELTYDLAVDASGRGRPSAIAAGLVRPTTSSGDPLIPAGPFLLLLGTYVVAAAFVVARLGR